LNGTEWHPKIWIFLGRICHGLNLKRQFKSEDQQALIDLLQKRLVENRRSEIAANIVQAKAEYEAGQIVRGSIDDIMNELNH
jgi:hypothetical protein